MFPLNYTQKLNHILNKFFLYVFPELHPKNSFFPCSGPGWTPETNTMHGLAMRGNDRGFVFIVLLYGLKCHMSLSNYHNRGQKGLQNPLFLLPGHIQFATTGGGRQPPPEEATCPCWPSLHVNVRVAHQGYKIVNEPSLKS